MKQITIKLNEEIHKAGKIKAIKQDKSFMQYVVDLIKKDLEGCEDEWRMGNYSE